MGRIDDTTGTLHYSAAENKKPSEKAVVVLDGYVTIVPVAIELRGGPAEGACCRGYHGDAHSPVFVLVLVSRRKHREARTQVQALLAKRCGRCALCWAGHHPSILPDTDLVLAFAAVGPLEGPGTTHRFRRPRFDSRAVAERVTGLLTSVAVGEP